MTDDKMKQMGKNILKAWGILAGVGCLTMIIVTAIIIAIIWI